MTAWHEDKNVINALDNWAINSAIELKELLDAAFVHYDQMDPSVKAILFGGLGKFVLSYANFRKDANPFEIAFEQAMIAVHSDARVQNLIQHSTEQMIDKKVDDLQ